MGSDRPRGDQEASGLLQDPLPLPLPQGGTPQLWDPTGAEFRARGGGGGISSLDQGPKGELADTALILVCKLTPKSSSYPFHQENMNFWLLLQNSEELLIAYTCVR